MGKKTFSPYAKGIPEKKEYVSRYDPIRDTSPSDGPAPRKASEPSGGQKPAAPSVGGAVRNEAGAGSIVSQHAYEPGVRAVGQPGGHASTRVAGATGNRPANAPPVDRDLLDGLEGNQRRQRGWGDDAKPNELCDGIAITPISRTDLKKKLAAQKSGGFLGGKN